MARERIAIEEIGPREAEKLLANVVDNRALRESRVERYANDMREGRWRLSNDAIVIDKDGHVRNGQHRLRGVVLSGTKQKFLVLRSADCEIYEVIDQVLIRSVGDTLAINGFNDVNLRAGICRTMMSAMNGHGNNCLNRPNLAVVEFHKEHEGEIEWVLDRAFRRINKGDIRLTRVDALAALTFAKELYGEEPVASFINRVRENTPKGKDDPAGAFVRFLAIPTNRQRYGGSGKRDLFLRTVSAIAADIEGRKMIGLKPASSRTVENFLGKQLVAK